VRIVAFVPIAAALTLAAGCTTAKREDTTSAAATAAKSATPAPLSTSPSDPADLNDKVWAFGELWHGRDENDRTIAETTVLEYRQPAAQGAPPPDGQTGYGWAAARIRDCATANAPKDFTVGGRGWQLTYPNGEVQRLGNTVYQQFPLPSFPIETTRLLPGRCANGWLTFPAPQNERPAFVEFAPELPAGRATMSRRWKVPA